MRQGADHAAGKITARTHQVTIRAAAFSGQEIAAIRKSLNVSQAVFADLLNVPKATAVSWERGLVLHPARPCDCFKSPKTAPAPCWKQRRTHNGRAGRGHHAAPTFPRCACRPSGRTRGRPEPSLPGDPARVFPAGGSWRQSGSGHGVWRVSRQTVAGLKDRSRPLSTWIPGSVHIGLRS